MIKSDTHIQGLKIYCYHMHF